MIAALCDDVLLDEDGVVRNGTAANVELRTLLREKFAGLDDLARQNLIWQITESAGQVTTRGAIALQHSLFHVREALRPRYPSCDEVKAHPRGLRIDGLLRINATCFYIHGFAYDNEAEPTALTLLTPDGRRIELLDRAFRHPHADADGFFTATYRRRASGFIAFFRTPSSQLESGWIVTQQNEQGQAIEARSPPVITDPRAARQAILSHCRLDRDGALMRDHIHPAIDQIQASLQSIAAVHEMVEIGQIPAEPPISVVIPLFERIDLIEHQFAAIHGDADFTNVELIYVLDSPELLDQTREKLTQLHGQYHQPARLIVMRENAGFALAVNIGATLSRGPELLILHSDVTPTAAGWLSEMSRSRKKLGSAIVGATLLYQDDSIQHAGYVFENDCVHQPFKGLHRDLVNQTEAHQVDAVSAAAMMIDRATFQQAGGFACAFASGDFDDADLCRRLKSTGVTSWILPSVRLYHLEGQSRPQRMRDLAQSYDRWLFARRRNA